MIPEDIEEWQAERLTANGYVRVVFRRSGVSLVVLAPREGDGPTTVTKIKGGQTLDERELHNLPAGLRSAIDKAVIA